MSGALVFLGFVVADRASRGRSQPSMMPGKVSDETTNHRALQAAFGIGGHRNRRERNRNSNRCENLLHGITNAVLSDNSPAIFSFRSKAANASPGPGPRQRTGFPLSQSGA
jgi:hypothetical protein